MSLADRGRLLLSRPWAGLALAGVVAVVALTVFVFSRWPGVLLGVPAGILLLGSLIARVHAWRAAPAPGDIHVIDGVPVHILAEGECRGTCPVIWVAGGHGEGLLMHHLHRVARAEGRSILFDRTGSGWTGPARAPVTITGEVERLKTLLERAGERGPFVLAGHSFGGLFCANFAHRHSELVAGVVLLDSTPPWNVAFAGRLSLGAVIRKAWWGSLASHFGLHRLVEPEIEDPRSDLARQLDDVAKVVNWHSVQPKSLLAEASIFSSTLANPFELVIGKGALGDLPLVLLAANPSPEQQGALRDDLQEALRLSEVQVTNLLDGLRDSAEQQVALSSRGRLKLMPTGSTHMFPYEFPEFVLDEVRSMMQRGGE